jgi:hypothetical protein
VSGRFESRPTKPFGMMAVNGWKLKAYQITLDDRPIAMEVIEAAGAILGDALPEPLATGEGVGFVILHRGADAIWLLADLWNGDTLHQYTFSTSHDAPHSFFPIPVGGPTACVWELSVHSHERDAYVEHILDPSSGPDIHAYLSDVRVR